MNLQDICGALIKEMSDGLKNWVMVVLTFLFVILYVAALLGWLKPLSDVTIVTRLEPIIFVIIGYYFGRLPAQQNEKTLKEEISRQTQKADAVQHAKEKALQDREALEEKVKNAKIALDNNSTEFPISTLSDASDRTTTTENKLGLQRTVTTALKILNS